jgi:diacylglycerol O-acyltransferase
VAIIVSGSASHALSIGMTTVNEEACFGIYADREALPDADMLAECIDASVDELIAIADQRLTEARVLQEH